MDMNNFLTLRLYAWMSRCFCRKAKSSSELAVFKACCTNTAETTLRTAKPITHLYTRKKTENHSLTFSTSTRQAGAQFANMISNIDSIVFVKVP
eukprot:Skav203813  [mRNA]  locus=scaffold1236:387319:390923:- [translate_table: standard]